MNRFITILTLLLLFLYSCTQPEQKFQKSELIAAKDLVPVLYDLHLADGLLSLSEVRNDYNDMDSLGQYSSILESYGYSLKQLNNTMEYYSNDPETLNEIYETVITQLTELEGEILSSDQEKEISAPNLWEGKTTWNLPGDGEQNKLEFEVPVKNPGIYKIIADIKIYRDDESVDGNKYVLNHPGIALSNGPFKGMNFSRSLANEIMGDDVSFKLKMMEL